MPKSVSETCAALSVDARSVLLERAPIDDTRVSYCRGSDELEILGIEDHDGQLSDFGYECREYLRRMIEMEVCNAS